MCLVFLLYFISFSDALEPPTGVPISRINLYPIGEHFRSFDGISVIPYSFLNDNYCDTSDGSDEPGTSACSNGRFFCADIKLGLSDLFSSRVNDGICDCCDGSDEYLGRVRCPNTCDALLRKKQEENRLLYEKYKKGHQLYLERIVELEAALLAAPEPESVQHSISEQETEEVDPATPSDIADKSESDKESAEPSSGFDEMPAGEPEDAGDEISPESPIPEPPVDKFKDVDFGPRQAFRMLAGKCFTFDDGLAHSYKLCPFDKVRQAAVRHSWSEHSGTSLGSWGLWMHADGLAPYSTMKYSNGEGCFDGPVRSTTVHILCGPEDTITAVNEPSRCDYEMTFETVAACSDSPEEFAKRTGLLL